MSHDSILGKVNEALMIILIVSSPVLIAAVVIGLLVGLLQALTQIQDQTLPQAVKLVVVLVLVILLGPVLSQQVANQASGIFDAFPIMTRCTDAGMSLWSCLPTCSSRWSPSFLRLPSRSPGCSQ